MSSSQKALSLISWQLLSELDELKHEQYSWLIQARESLLGNWKAHRARYRSWRGKVDGIVDDLVQKGDAEGANWLAQTILRDHMATDPAEFEVTMPTGNGAEIIHIRGCRDSPPAAIAQQPPTVPGVDPEGVQLQLPSPAAAVGTTAASSVSKKKRGPPRSSVPRPSAPAAADTEHPVLPPKQHPTKATTESRVITRAQSIRGKRKKTARDSSRKKIAKSSSTKGTKRGPGRPPSKSVTEEIDPGIDPECHYLAWTTTKLREEVQARKMKPCRHLKATLVRLLIQNDKDGENDPGDTSQPTLDDEARSPKATEDDASGSMDKETNATGNGKVDAAGDGRAEAGDHGEAEEHDGPSTNEDSEAVLDAIYSVLPELSGNEEGVPEVTVA